MRNRNLESESGIRNPESGIRNPIPDSGFRFRIPVPDSGFRFPGFRVAHFFRAIRSPPPKSKGARTPMIRSSSRSQPAFQAYCGDLEGDEDAKTRERKEKKKSLLTNFTTGVLDKVYYEKDPPQGPTPYPFYIPFIEKKVPLSHTYFRKSCSHFHVVLFKVN